MGTRIWHRRRCSNCYVEMVALSRQGIVICDACEMKGVTMEQVEKDKATFGEEMARVSRVSANATCRDPRCPCHRAPGAR